MREKMMNERSTIAALEARLDELERRHARTRGAALVLGAVAAIVVLTAQTQAGRAPGIFGDATGQHVEVAPGGISLYNASNRRQARLYIDSDGFPTFELTAPSGTKPGIEIVATTHAGHVKIASPGGTERAYLGTFSDDTAGVEIEDSSGKLRTYSGTFSDGIVGHLAYDTSANPRSRVIVGGNGIPSLSVLSPDGKLIIEANQADNGGFIRTRDISGVDRAYMGLYTQGTSGFTAYNASGTATWSSP